VLYESADSYAQARILYLQNRRFELGVTVDDSDVDPFSDPFADPFAQ
jgi:phospholipid-binding lipoprotein MlaA